jgi:FkbM family methyltransferase
MTEIIRQLRGHHEPQEELAFHLIVQRLLLDTPRPTMIELGSFWAYYSLWLLKSCPSSTTYLVEPDPYNLAAGLTNFALNQVQPASFLQASIGEQYERSRPFLCESDHVTRPLSVESLPSLLKHFRLSHLDILFADIQGAETALLRGAAPLLQDKRVRFVLISTHDIRVTGDPLTHQHCLDILRSLGMHIIAEHSPPESCSGDGLIAGSFDERDRDLIAPISYGRSRDSCVGELEHYVARSESRNRTLEAELEAARAQAATLQTRIQELEAIPHPTWQSVLNEARSVGSKTVHNALSTVRQRLRPS